MDLLVSFLNKSVSPQWGGCQLYPARLLFVLGYCGPGRICHKRPFLGNRKVICDGLPGPPFTYVGAIGGEARTFLTYWPATLIWAYDAYIWAWSSSSGHNPSSFGHSAQTRQHSCSRRQQSKCFL
jgi:hypothetical protein